MIDNQTVLAVVTTAGAVFAGGGLWSYLTSRGQKNVVNANAKKISTSSTAELTEITLKYATQVQADYEKRLTAMGNRHEEMIAKIDVRLMALENENTELRKQNALLMIENSSLKKLLAAKNEVR